jgi:hypothetical protein
MTLVTSIKMGHIMCERAFFMIPVFVVNAISYAFNFDHYQTEIYHQTRILIRQSVY